MISNFRKGHKSRNRSNILLYIVADIVFYVYYTVICYLFTFKGHDVRAHAITFDGEVLFCLILRS